MAKAKVIVTVIIACMMMVTPVSAASRGGHTVKYTRSYTPTYATTVDEDEDVQYFATSFEGDGTQYWECSYR